MRLKLTSPILLLIGLVLNILIMKQRTGSEYSHYETKKKFKAIIVRFTRFKHKTSVHWEKKTIRNNVKIHLDLTKEREALLLEANNIVKCSNDVKLCFVEINCRLKIMWEDELWPGSFSLHWKICKENYRLIRIITFFSFKFVVSLFGFIIGFYFQSS